MKAETLVVALLIVLGISFTIAAGYVGGKRADARIEIMRINQCEEVSDDGNLLHD